IEVFSMYGYDYMKKIILRHLNHLPPKDKNILTIAVNLWTKPLVIRQCVEDFQLGIESYQTLLNPTKPRWDATGFEYKHDFMIDEALDYLVKEFKVNRLNLGLNTRFWTRKDMDRSKEFMFSIQKWLKTRRILRNLESFVGEDTSLLLLVSITVVKQIGINIVLKGNSAKSMTTDKDGNLKIRPPVTTEEHQQVQREEKARTILLSALPDEHMDDFYHMIDARDIWNAIKIRFGGNAESKNMQKSLLKQSLKKLKFLKWKD
nr:xylulose kinase-1 [Tanacetum cinerariifolium]